MDPRRNRTRAHLDDHARREEEYFDERAQAEGEFDPFMPSGWRTIRRRFEQLVKPRRELRVLDIGCGTGQSRQLYTPYAASYVGVDLSTGALDRARAKFPDDRWERADARQLPFADDSFDLVAFSSVLHHIAERIVALREAMRVLVPGGATFAFDPNLLNPAMALFRYPKSPLYSQAGVSPDEAPLLPRTLRTAFADAGFVAIRQRAQSDIAYRTVAPRLLDTGLRVYNIADRWFERIGLGRWFGAFIMTAGLRAP